MTQEDFGIRSAWSLKNDEHSPTRPPRRKQISWKISRIEIRINSFLLLRFSTTAPAMVPAPYSRRVEDSYTAQKVLKMFTCTPETKLAESLKYLHRCRLRQRCDASHKPYLNLKVPSRILIESA